MSLARQLKQLLISLRPRQWTKNLLVYAALIFSERLFDGPAVAAATAAFVIFCLLSGAVYLVNDLADLEQDRRHPVKRDRPLASGKLSRSFATVAAICIVVIALVGAFSLGTRFGVAGVVYFVMMTAYSLALKHVVILDVLIVALGFVLRAVAGALAIDVAFSNWLLICTLLGALFLALAKRRHELTL